MDHLVDTSVLVRDVDPSDPQHDETRYALDLLKRRNAQLCIVPQVLFELWVVCTRPASANGVGLTPAVTRQLLSEAEKTYILIRDHRDVYDAWLELVSAHGVSGKTAHDVRLVAAMQVHGISSILTYNVRDFLRFPHIRVLYPQNVR